MKVELSDKDLTLIQNALTIASHAWKNDAQTTAKYGLTEEFNSYVKLAEDLGSRLSEIQEA